MANRFQRFGHVFRAVQGIAFFSIVAGLFGFPVQVAAQEVNSDQPKFMRFVKESGSEGHVDTAIASYRNEAGVEVDLIAAVHVADRVYYEKLQERFEDYDAVLYEMVKPKDAVMTQGMQSGSPVSALQIGMKNMLALDFQLDAIDYTKENFVHADMDPDTMFREQEESGESILGLMLTAMMEEQKNAGSRNPLEGIQILYALMSKDSAYKLKFIFAQQLEDMESILSGIDEGQNGEGSVLVSGRNRVAMEVLDEQMNGGKRKLAIFYGAGHMIDFEERLTGLGFEKTNHEWLTAWDIRKEK